MAATTTVSSPVPLRLGAEAAPNRASTNSTTSTSILSAGTKRKRASKSKFYAVRIGYTPGIYHSWADCLEQVRGFKNATFKSFISLHDAESFMLSSSFEDALKASRTPTKFYAVASGRVPGVYTDWTSAQQQITGWIKPKHKAFTTRAEAEAFLKAFVGSTGVGGLVSHASVGQNGDAKNKPTPPKKQKKAASKFDRTSAAEQIKYEAGEGPLLEGAEDGFDSRIILNPQTGKVEYKTEEQNNAMKWYATGMATDSMLRIYTDGSSLGNGQRGAVAGVGVYFGPKDSRYVSSLLLQTSHVMSPSSTANLPHSARNVSEALTGPRQTNNRAELTAISRAIEIAPRDRDIVIFSDSNYAIKCVTEWYKKWRLSGWISSSRKPVDNKDLVESIVNKIEERINEYGVQTTFKWLKGHANDPGNVAADELAVQGAREAQLSNGTTGLDRNAYRS
ncbi:putative ribonuclease H [Cryomyces antarcticus]